MKVNCTKTMKSHWMVDYMSQIWRIENAQNNKHGRRRKIINRMPKNKCRREINKRAEEEIREIY